MVNPTDLLTIEVIAAPTSDTTIQGILHLPKGSTVNEALEHICVEQPIFQTMHACAVGIFGKIVERTTVLQDQDRIELYRSLSQDPKITRRKRAQR